MFSLQLADPKTILCIGAHCDDIEIGCGGTLASWARSYPQARFIWAVFASAGPRGEETRTAARALLGPAAQLDFEMREFRDSYFPAQFAEIKEALEQLRHKATPDVVLTHHAQDRHQDHRLLAELTWNAFRNQLVLEYEIPKFEGDLGQPNVYVPLSAERARHKVETLLKSFPSQAGRDWFTADTFTALMRLRGIECRSPSGLAEAFHGRKLVVA
jgi:LmbE family N-acetylglucosaminyl deacetylase